MNTKFIADTKLAFETNPQSWRDFGIDLVDASAPAASQCNRSPIARKVLAGRWEEAYQDWLKAGEFSRESEEPMLAFILATKVTFHRQVPASIPDDLPKRIWKDGDLKKHIKLLQDVAYWRSCVADLLKMEGRPALKAKYQLGKLLLENKPEEAEKIYRDNGMDQDFMAEHDLALIRTCAQAHGAKADEDRARQMIWFYIDRDQRCGPISEFDLCGLFENNRLQRSTTRVWKKGMQEWEHAALHKALSRVPYDGPLPPPI